MFYVIFLWIRNPGLVSRSLEYIIQGMQTPEFKSRFGDSVSLEMSLLEDYQNTIYDLLTPTPREGNVQKQGLIVRTDAQNVIHITRLTVFIKLFVLI